MIFDLIQFEDILKINWKSPFILHYMKLKVDIIFLSPIYVTNLYTRLATFSKDKYIYKSWNRIRTDIFLAHALKVNFGQKIYIEVNTH